MIVKGSKVVFGRPNGKQTTGEVVKVNRTTYKIRTLEERGNGRGSGAGAIWKVHKTLVRPLEGSTPSPLSGNRGPARTGAAPTENLVAGALGKLTTAERSALAQYFRQGYIKTSMF